MTSTTPVVKLVYLGGLAEVGKNMLLLECDGECIVIDCGLAFPEEDQPGIDLVLPDISYLRDGSLKLLGVFITHGHEDHIGALPYLLPELPPVPIHATRLTLGLISGKLEEAKLRGRADLRELDPDVHPVIEAGPFGVEPFRVCHSIPDAVGFGVATPAGRIVVTGDFKFDETPIDGRLTDYARLEAFGDEGVHLLLSDCVHVESPGRTPSERLVGETYDRVFARSEGRIFIATFASLIARIQQTIDIAYRHERLVAVLGRSLEQNVRIGLELGYLSDPHQVLIGARAAASLPDDRVVYIVTGAQGEPMAALGRIANGDHREVTIGVGDTVIISSTPIPGNETAVFRVIDRLFRAGADVVYGSSERVHVSGHGSQDELLQMLALTRPRHVIPVHGEHRHMAKYADLAVGAGIPPDRIAFAENGDLIEITPEHVAVAGQVPSGSVYVAGGTVGAVGDVVLRDRRALSRDGMVMIVLSVDRDSGEILAGPEIVTRGFVHVKESAVLLAATKQHVREALVANRDGAGVPDVGDLSRQMREAAASYLFRETRRRPMVLPMVLEV